MMKKIIFLLLIAFSFTQLKAQTSNVKEIGEADFNKYISNYSQGIAGFKYKGTKPAIIDFYADWCGPCKKLSPILEELSKEYKSKVDFYKLDVDKAPNISKAFGVSSIPMLLYVPVNGAPQIITGLYPKEELIKTINFIFFSGKQKK